MDPIFPGPIDPTPRLAGIHLPGAAGYAGGDSAHPRTDLAVEAHAAVQQAMGAGQQIPGVTMQEEQVGSVHVSRVNIWSREGEQALGKVAGRYVTLDAPELRRRNRQVQDEVARILTDELARLMNLGPDDLVLVVGLGNWNATPDALGPRVVANLLVTRHLRQYLPQELVGHLRGVAAVAPGVLGLTGIETSDIVRGIVSQVHPRAVIVIDALAARSLARVGTSIQIADTGINPGSGVGNHRAGITEESLGVPVFAIGVPTVVYATTIANDTLDLLVSQLRQQHKLLDIVGQMDAADRQALVNEVLQPSVGDLVVTPKDVDVMITDLSRILAGAMNAALHPGVSKEEMAQYLN